MPGLDPGIHGMPFVQILEFRASGTAWMTGSSPVMTVCERLELVATYYWTG
jgi:hypothetical protein